MDIVRGGSSFLKIPPTTKYSFDPSLVVITFTGSRVEFSFSSLSTRIIH